VSFGMLMNLASVVNADTPDMLWSFLRRYSPEAAPGVSPFFDGLVGHAVRYYQDFVRPKKRFRPADATERAALEDLAASLRALSGAQTPESLQDLVYEVGKRHPFPELRAWFLCLYQVLLGQEEGPRFGGFIALYGVAETIALIEARLAAPGLAPDLGLGLAPDSGPGLGPDPGLVEASMASAADPS
jgi:lysyl-tRNA synthetase class 1